MVLVHGFFIEGQSQVIACIEFEAKQHDLFHYVVFTYTFHLWKAKEETKDE